MHAGRIEREIFTLMYDAGNYQNCPLSQIKTCFVDAAVNEKALAWCNKEGQLVGFMTWAMLKPEHVQAFLSGEYRVEGDAFKNDEGELWVMDFLAPYGGCGVMMRYAQAKFARRYGEGTIVQWKRSRRNQPKMGYAVARDLTNELSA